MRLFVFAIGGTGSRVLTSLVMQLASGMCPKDHEGNPIKNLTIVPIIVDPHEDNSGLQQVKNLLNNYRTIRKRIYGDDPNGEGFFGVKIETLREAEPESGVSSDNFFFRMQRVSDNSFDKFIGLESMSLENKLFAQMLFSDQELQTEMKEGFYGSPNIGCVALNEFRRSEDFTAFRTAYKPGDRIFFIGSIFGGTGASGLPLFISSIRDLGHRDSDDDGRAACSESPIGALIVMPYFSITPDDNSPINENDFTIKTRSALRYYYTNLNQYINNIYYIADPEGTKAFENDPGCGNQSKNKAHIVEFAGALAIMDFLAESETDMLFNQDSLGRVVVEKCSTKAYGLVTDNSYIHFKGLSAQTDKLVMMPMMSFYLLREFMQNHLENMLEKPFAKDHTPKIQKSIYDNREIKELFKMFDEWTSQMSDHGPSAHNLDLFKQVNDKNYAGAFYDEPSTKKGLFGGRKDLKPKDIQLMLDKAAQEVGDKEPQERRWFTLAQIAMNKLINEMYDTDTLLK